MRQEFCHLQIQVVWLTNTFLPNQTHVPLEDPIKSWLCFFSYSEANDLPLPNPALGIITSKKGARMLVAWGWALDKAGLGWIFFCLQKGLQLYSQIAIQWKCMELSVLLCFPCLCSCSFSFLYPLCLSLFFLPFFFCCLFSAEVVLFSEHWDKSTYPIMCAASYWQYTLE